MSTPGLITAIYRTEYFYMVRGILCRNSFHHYTMVPGAGAQFINQLVLANMIVEILELQSAYIQPIQLVTSNVTNMIPESYSHFFQGGSGAINATPEDPRLGVYVKIETDHPARRLYTGGCNISGIPQNWTMDSPVLHEEAQTRFRNTFNNFVAQMGATADAHPIKWVIFSRTAYKANPLDPIFWYQRVSHISVRRSLLSLRTRRPRPEV